MTTAAIALAVTFTTVIPVSPLSAQAATAAPRTPASRVAARTPARAPLVMGADRLFTEYPQLIRGKSVALVSNHSGRLANGMHLADALHSGPGKALGVRLKALFGMEYNIRSNDYSIQRDPEQTVDSATGAPKYSLYGEIHKPTPEMLDGVEVIVYDIQEVGARFYEHVNILGFVMEAAAEKKIPVVVLDRPNPLGGRSADGFVADSAAFYRFGSYTAIPALHGMTPAELARFYHGERMLRGGVQGTLHVVPMKGWTRDMWLDNTGQPWSKPSPNLVAFSSLVAYAGTCLFESLNLSEGRGSDSPFELIGAPWLDNQRAVAMLNALNLPGTRFAVDQFTPIQRPFHGRPPAFAGQSLPGIRLHVTDRAAFKPYRAGVALMWAVNALHADKLEWKDAVLDRLAATPRLKNMLQAGRTPQEIFASWEPELTRFHQRADKYRLYP
ncbi:DUF1343 domain-containing protein [Gemmatimonas aurantiaca]|uniref:exo-beta-N-acetylmuramidase NamZ family protein n=1 Tax=Gemmatimonas aurantiaca TaxID=173480 RepID=UPI00301C426B